MKTAWAIAPFCEAATLTTRSRDLEPLGHAIRLVLSCGLPALSEEFRRILSVERCGNRAASSSSVQAGSYRRALCLTSRHSAARAPSIHSASATSHLWARFLTGRQRGLLAVRSINRRGLSGA